MIFPSLVIGATTTAGLRWTIVHARGNEWAGVCTRSVTTSRFRSAKCRSLEIVFQLPPFTPAIVVAAVSSGKLCRGARRGERLGAWHKRPLHFEIPDHTAAARVRVCSWSIDACSSGDDDRDVFCVL